MMTSFTACGSNGIAALAPPTRLLAESVVVSEPGWAVVGLLHLARVLDPTARGLDVLAIVEDALNCRRNISRGGGRRSAFVCGQELLDLLEANRRSQLTHDGVPFEGPELAVTPPPSAGVGLPPSDHLAATHQDLGCRAEALCTSARAAPVAVPDWAIAFRAISAIGALDVEVEHVGISPLCGLHESLGPVEVRESPYVYPSLTFTHVHPLFASSVHPAITLAVLRHSLVHES